MDALTNRTTRGRLWALALLLLALSGCKSPTATNGGSLGGSISLAGEWSGTITGDASSSATSATVTQSDQGILIQFRTDFYATSASYYGTLINGSLTGTFSIGKARPFDCPLPRASVQGTAGPTQIRMEVPAIGSHSGILGLCPGAPRATIELSR